MKQTTFGSALKEFRQRKSISQFELAVKMDWKGTSPLVQLEHGRRTPRPETIDRLGESLGLTYDDIYYLHGLASP